MTATRRGPLSFFLLALCAEALAAQNVTDLGKPLNIPPSQYWDGDDGPWSTFRVEMGRAKQQQIRVLPGSDQSSTWLVLPEGCPIANHASYEECADARGGLYMRNASSTWQERGFFELDTYLEGQVGYTGDGLYGFDVVTLGWKGDELPVMDNQSIAGFLTDDFQLGHLALNPRSINFTNHNAPIPSLLSNLRTMKTSPIPSLSWSYTAGAYNLAPKVFGSLVLGGYDSTRLERNNLTFPFGSDVSLDLQVAIQLITANNSDVALLANPIISYISTLVPDIWLPVEACTAFVRAFHLTYSNNMETFYVNSSMHALNLAKNPVVKFQVGPGATGEAVTISMPYFNFYLGGGNVTDPIIKDGGFRFPIRRASKDTQYILGRAFLQSAHITADYDRWSFNLSQALYPTSSTKATIVPVLSPVPASSGSSQGGKLSTGVIAGIAAGAAILGAIIAAAAFLLLRRRRKNKNAKFHEMDDTDVQNTMSHEMHGQDVRPELGGGLKHELLGDSDPKVELSARDEQEKPLEMADTQIEIYELPAHEKKHAEMEGEGHVSEVG